MRTRTNYLFAAVLLIAALLAGCSGGKMPAPATPGEVKGETYDAGQVSALVPEGWKAFPTTDVFDEYEGDYDPNAFSIYKGAQSEWDQLAKPGITITRMDTASFVSAKDWYDDVKDIEVAPIGSYTCTGYTGTSLVDYPYTVIEMVDGDTTVQVAILTESNGEKIALEDADVQAILASIKTAR